MLEDVLSAGDKLELIMVMSEEKRKKMEEADSISAKPFSTQIDMVIDDEKIRVLMPIMDGKLIPLPMNSRFDAFFYSKNGIFTSRVTVTDRYKENKFYFLVLTLNRQLQKHQRRQYFRLECNMKIPYRCLTQKEMIEIHEDEFKLLDLYDEKIFTNGVAMDLSGGGMRFTSDELLRPEQCLLMDFSFVTPDNEKGFPVLAKVISSRHQNRIGSCYEQRVEYIDIEGKIREKIIKYIFEQERINRQLSKS